MSGILALLLGRRLCDRYRVDSVIATGGMGSVCRAFDLKLERLVAVKVITAVAPDEDEAGRLRERFHREARAAARLRHPNVVTVHDYGTDPDLGIDFLIMEMLAGEDLSARMRRAGGPLPVDEAVEIMREAGMGLAAGHRAGLVHRDVKPANIYLVAEPGGWEVKVLDFGIAQVRAADGETAQRLTQFGVPHTPRYASPEQLAGGEISPASDVYSLALTGLEMLAGAYPEGLNSTGDDKEAARRIKRMLAGRGDVPLRLAAVLRRAMRLDPAGRFHDADAFLDALDEWTAAPPADPAHATGYASIVPGMAPGPQRAGSAHVPPAAAFADDDRTMIAGPHLAAASPLRSSVELAMRGPPPAAPPAPGAQQGPAPAQADGSTTADPAAPKPRRRIRIRPAGWALVLVALLVVALVLFRPMERAGAIRAGEPNTELPVPRITPPGGADLAPEEFRRITGGSEFAAGDRVYVVITASYPAERAHQAPAARDNLRRKGYDVGLGNLEVYSELRNGWVAVVAGPYPTRSEAEEVLPDLRRDGGSDAFLKRLTIRKPQ